MPALLAAVAFTLANLVAELSAPRPPPPEANVWATLKTVDGVELASAPPPSPGGAPWGRAEGEIAAPLERVVAHLTDFPSLARWMPRLAELRVLSRADDEAIVYFRFDLPWPIADREWTLRYRWRLDGERFVMTWCDANDRGPPPSRAVRVAPLRGYWELWPAAAGTTRARYVFLASLGGSLPRAVAAETAWKQPLATFRGVRAATANTSAAR